MVIEYENGLIFRNQQKKELKQKILQEPYKKGYFRKRKYT